MPDVEIIDILKQYCCTQWTSFVFSMVKERLGLPKDQTIVFNVHRFPFYDLLLWEILMFIVHREDKSKSAADRKNINKLTV